MLFIKLLFESFKKHAKIDFKRLRYPPDFPKSGTKMKFDHSFPSCILGL